MARADGRPVDALRPTEYISGFQINPEGSVLYRCGETRVLISASVSEKVPDWMRDSGEGWVTAEYAMHPRANPTRKRRIGKNGQIDGRSSEIQRLIGRSLRAAVDMKALGARKIDIDCDVLDADGGTRTASITGGFIALAIAVNKLKTRGVLKGPVMRAPVAAISVGLVGGDALLDLCYTEDRDAAVDLNVVGTGDGSLVEIQGTAEGAPVASERFSDLIALASGALPTLVEHQKKALEQAGVAWDSLFV